jgi:hypothetical protein
MADPVVTPTTPAAVVAPVAPAVGTPEHDAAMIAKVDAAHAAAGGTPTATPEAVRPAWLPAKFKSAEDFAAAYTALEQKQSAAAPVVPATPAAPTPGAVLAVPTDADAAAAAAVEAAKGLDMSKLQAEFVEKGDLTPETRAALEAKGYPKEMVDGYIAGQKALAADYDQSAFTAAGGQEEYGKLTTWAKTALSDGEKVAFNKAVTSGDKAQAAFAIAGLKARHTAAFGSQPSLVSGTNASGVSGEVYGSMAEVTADMKKPEYKKDPAFQAKVMAKLDRSNLGKVQVRG